MKRVGLLLFALLFLSNSISAEDKKIFMGYQSGGEEKRYLYVNGTDYAIMGLRYTEGREQIFQHAVKCMNDSYWYKAKLLSYKGENDFYSYKFKFYWRLDSKIMYVDVNGNQLSCRD